ncbi:MAG: bifunctional serine/threonine-protein kinase/formylglycine-generating enzyme family protein, partial [Planctomycetota bacterium]
LNRQVALKVLPCSLVGDASTIARFHREARAAATLRHPNIVTVYAEGLEQGICYFAMEMVEGEPLDRVVEDLRAARAGPRSRDDTDDDAATEPKSLLHRCRPGREYFDTVARLISEVADALAYAHAEGIIHRDVKPSNLILARDGRLVLLDFGIARVCDERAMTLTGSFVGTPRYMSPEQIAGGHDLLDHRSDIYSLGVTLYELLTLRPLFDGQTRERVIGQILTQTPPRLRRIERRIPVDLDTICCKAIAKRPDQRYSSAGELAEDLRRYLNGRVIKAQPPGVTDRFVKLLRRRKVAAILSACLVLALAWAGNIAWKHYSTRWAQQEAMAQIDRLIQKDAYFPALSLAERAQRYVPDHPLLADRWPRMSRQFIIATDPPGARVFLSEYRDRRPRWKYLGRTPIKQARIPFGTYRWKVEKPGFATIEVVRSNDLPSPPLEGTSLSPRQIDFTLHRSGEFPPDMVWIPPSDLDQKDLYHGRREIPSAPAFLIDKYEVTNGQFQEFVFSGGYTEPSFWEHGFVRDGEAIPWSEAIEAFRDETGRPGPATWADGRYPKGKKNCPVGGINWYEAAAYARFRNKDLPTIFHWTLAARADDEPYRITCRSNFADGPAPVGRHTGMGRFGLYDAAGNAREWCSNALEGSPELRCILGGTWGELETAFINCAMRSPWDRDASNGLRCVKYLDG